LDVREEKHGEKNEKNYVDEMCCALMREACIVSVGWTEGRRPLQNPSLNSGIILKRSLKFYNTCYRILQ
jgi:hypothetical protein